MNSFSWMVFLFVVRAVAKWSRCQHIVLDLSMADGDMVFGRVQLFGVGYWPWRWASFWKPLCQMVDRFDELGPRFVLRTGVAGSDNRHTRLDARSWCVRYLFWIFIKFFISTGLMPNFLFIYFDFPIGMQRKVKKGVLRHAYWILNTVAIVYSFVIAFFYWTMLHDPGKCPDCWPMTIDISCPNRIIINLCPPYDKIIGFSLFPSEHRAG